MSIVTGTKFHPVFSGMMSLMLAGLITCAETEQFSLGLYTQYACAGFGFETFLNFFDSLLYSKIFQLLVLHVLETVFRSPGIENKFQPE